MKNNLIHQIETYIKSYATLADERYSLPLALWTLGTHAHLEFDTFPYVVVMSATKRSGKTRLAEIISFVASNPRNYSAITGAIVFRSIRDEHPTLFFDEAETLSREAQSDMTSILNVGYRKGAMIPRVAGSGIAEFPTYCPKMFILIGDVRDTLRDRSLIVEMRRAEAPKRFIYDHAKAEGAELREQCSALVKLNAETINATFNEHQGLTFLADREEEIWTPLFVLCAIFCPSRLNALSEIAADMSADKTAEKRRYTELAQAEDTAMDESYRNKLLMDLYTVMLTNGKVIRSSVAVEQLKAIPTSPWRRYRGNGLDDRMMADMLSPFGLKPVRLALGSGRGNQTFCRGYKLADVVKAMEKL